MTAPRPRVEGEAMTEVRWKFIRHAVTYPGFVGDRDLFFYAARDAVRECDRLTAEVERLRGIAHRAIDILDGMERRTMDIDPETGEFDDAVDVLRTALDRAALSLPTPAPEATE